MNTTVRVLICTLSYALAWNCGYAQTPFDLFTDSAPSGAGSVRLAAWNLEQVNTTGPARDFIPGADRDADNDIKAATFAKAIRDLGLDILFIVENQPRRNEENRIEQIRDFLNQGISGAPWRSNESRIDYNGGFQPVDSGDFGGLQFAVIWNSTRATIDSGADQLLLHLRQSDTLRAPWQVPVTAGALQFDVIVLHLKSGGVSPQLAEMTALAAELESRLRQPSARHTIVCGAWNKDFIVLRDALGHADIGPEIPRCRPRSRAGGDSGVRPHTGEDRSAH